MKNMLTVDLEDWFSVEIFKEALPPDTWQDQVSVVERSTLDVLDLFDKHGQVKATFFVLGWVADRYPDLIREVANRGHEIACHSYYHRMVSSLTPDEFRKDTEKAVNAIVKACSRIPLGYRSPSYGMKRGMTWAFDILAELGFEYDSSICPVKKHDIYGDPDAPREPFAIETSSGKTIIEVPIITVFASKKMVGGGGWLRQHPYWYNRWLIRRMNKNRKMPIVIYFHPWELDRDLPEKRLWSYMKKQRGSLRNWARQYMGNITMKIKLEKLLSDKEFEFVPIKDALESLKSRRKELK